MFQLPWEVRQTINTIEQAGYEAVVVGGPVRDLLREMPPHDWDIATSAPPEQIIALFPKTVPTGIKHGTVTVIIGDMPLEVTTYRREAEYQNHRKPEAVEFVSNLEEDLKRRDFTINAMAYRVEQEVVVDLFGGQADLKNGMIRAVGDARERFEEDALRMLRAVRFACKLDFKIEPQTLAAITEKAPLLSYISEERIAAELIASLCAATPQPFELLEQTGLATYCLSELSFWKPEDWKAAAIRLQRVPMDKKLRLAALFCQAGKTEEQCAVTAKKALKRLKLDNDTILGVTSILMHGNVSFPMQDAALKRLVRAVGESLLEATLWLSVITKQEEQQAEKWVAKTVLQYQNLKQRGEPVFLQQLNLSGTELKNEGISGKEIGVLLHALLEWVTDYPEYNQKTLLLERAKCMREEGMK